MLTYQDYLLIGEGEEARADFARRVINDYRSSEAYQIAKIADDYDRGKNTTITNYKKTLTTLTGKIVDEPFSATHRSASRFYSIFSTYLTQYLLGNGVTWGEESTADALGDDFDTRLQEIGKNANVHGFAYGFWNLDHLESFSALEFAPLYDEENGALMAGVRFWQIDDSKPLRAVLYDPDGYTSFLWRTAKDQADPVGWERLAKDVFFRPRRTYIVKVVSSEADGDRIYDGENYPSFPIVPLYANRYHESDIVNLREKIDAYDFIMNGFVDDLDNARLYWIIKGAGGMDDVDLAQFLDRLHTVGAAAPADGQEVEAKEVDIPYSAREALLDRIRKQLYNDAMILNVEDVAAGAATATQIKAAYEPQNVKADQFEYCVIEFLRGILAVAGIDDKPSFTRSVIVNTMEEMQNVVMAATYLPEEYITEKILNLLGDGDQIEDVLEMMEAQEAESAGLEEDWEEAGAEEAEQVEGGAMQEFGDDVIAMLEQLLQDGEDEDDGES